MSTAIERLERWLCALYALEPGVSVRDFVVGDEDRPSLLASLPGSEGAPREALLIHEDDDELNLALLLEDRLSLADPLADADLDGHCALLEGVSHLLYVVDRAQARRPVSRLELELQAEVDKYLGTFFVRHEAGLAVDAEALRRRLFQDFALQAAPQDLPRYREATRLAARYCAWLCETYLTRARLDGLLPEARRFWRMSQAEKIGHIESR